MEILKEGDLTRNCMYCGAKVKLSLEDIKIHDYGSVKTRYWVCPCCGQEIHNI